MAVLPTIPVQTGSVAKSAGRGILKQLGFLRFFSLIVIVLFFIVPVVKGILIGVEANDPLPALEYLEPVFLNPTLNLQSQSLAIIEQDGLILPNLGFFGSIKAGAIAIWRLWQPMWVIWKWIWLWYMFSLVVFYQNTSEQPKAWALGFSLFALFTIIFLFTFHGDVLSVREILFLPYQAFVDFAQSIFVIADFF